MLEIEKNGSLAFVDIPISLKNRKFVTSVYCKITFSSAFTNFEHFIAQWKFHKSFRLCSNYDNFYPEIETLKSIFKQ